ncbi:hypothetical protein DCC26_01030 [Auritidibacter sp. NML120779]|nr:hypothetical protein DCC26_01030 [Auritidibacter sp. NML120779]
MTQDSAVLTETVDGIEVVHIDTGLPHNELTIRAMEELEGVLERWRQDAPRAAILTGRSECFSAGLALEEVVDASREEFSDFVRLEYRCMRLLEEMPLVTIAALAGPCIGNAAELALACDFRVATDGVRIGLPEVGMGLMAPAQRLVKFMSIQQARRILLDSRLLPAEEALQLELVDEIVSSDGLLSTAIERATSAAALPPVAVRLTKENLLRESSRGQNHDQEEIAGAIESFATTECAERIATYLDRRATRDS